MKKATSINEQIKKLEDRGMILDEGYSKAKEELLDIGYFRLGFYCFPFEKAYPEQKNRTHEYKEGTLLSDVVKLYYLDVDLRNLLSKYIYRIEVHFRTNLTYLISNKLQSSTIWFVDPEIMNKKFIDSFELKIYNNLRKNNKVIRNHHGKYKDDEFAPAWKVLEFMTFGSVLKIFQNVKDEVVKKEIISIYDISSTLIFENYMSTIIEIRNTCAHGGVMFDLKLGKSIKRGPAIKIDNTNRNRLYSAICVIKHILGKISKNREIDLEEQLKIVFEKYNDNKYLRPIIEQQIGYIFND